MRSHLFSGFLSFGLLISPLALAQGMAPTPNPFSQGLPAPTAPPSSAQQLPPDMAKLFQLPLDNPKYIGKNSVHPGLCGHPEELLAYLLANRGMKPGVAGEMAAGRGVALMMYNDDMEWVFVTGSADNACVLVDGTKLKPALPPKADASPGRYDDPEQGEHMLMERQHSYRSQASD